MIQVPSRDEGRKCIVEQDDARIAAEIRTLRQLKAINQYNILFTRYRIDQSRRNYGESVFVVTATISCANAVNSSMFLRVLRSLA